MGFILGGAAIAVKVAANGVPVALLSGLQGGALIGMSMVPRVEIAQALQCSEYAVFFHRKNLRSKLGLTNKGVNLYSYLQTFTHWEE
jgi:hypothetical protein